MRRIFALLGLLAGLSLAFPALSQAQPDSRPDRGEKRERLQSLLQERFIQGLGLNENQAAQFSKVMRKYHQKRKELREQMKQDRQQLETVSSSSDASQASQVVARIQKTRSELDQLDNEQFKELKPILSPQQQAKYLLIMEEIRHEMMRIKRGNAP